MDSIRKYSAHCLERREGILSAAHKYIGGGSQNGALLGRVLDGRVPSQKILVGLSSSSDSNYVLESYQRIGDDIFVQEVVPYGDGHTVELDELKAISPLLGPRHEEKIPNEHGICFDGALLKEPITPIYEYVALG